MVLQKISAVVSGGKKKERYDSVYEGLRACKDTEYVLIHDGARPFIDHGIIERGLMAAAQTGASVTGMPSKDTVKITQMRMGMSVKLRIAAVYGSSDSADLSVPTDLWRIYQHSAEGNDRNYR